MKLPKSWSDITVRDFIEIQKIAENNTYANNAERLIAITAYFTGALDKVPLHELNTLEFLAHPELMPAHIQQKFFFKNKLYRLNLNMSKLSAGQYIDLTTFTKKPEEIIPNTAKIMAVLCLPCNWLGRRKKYNGEEMLYRTELFMELPITMVYPVTVFFARAWKI